VSAGKQYEHSEAPDAAERVDDYVSNNQPVTALHGKRQSGAL
jgi:hypothetical protein